MIRIALCVLLAIAVEINLSADDPPGYWPQWRGPHRDNLSASTGLLTQWPEGGPPIRWTVNGIGDGIAAAAIADGRIFVLGDFDGHEYVTSLDEATGHRLWTTPIGQAAGQSPLMRWLSQRTPTIDDDRLYAITAKGELVCLTTTNGKEQWRRNYRYDFGSGRRGWGFCDYPVVDDDRLICFPLGTKFGIVALDKFDGTVSWHSPAPAESRSMYGAAIPVEIDGKKQLVAAMNSGIGGWSAADGTRLWWYPGSRGPLTSTHTPMRMSDRSFVCPLKYGSGIVRLRPHQIGPNWEVNVEYAQDTVVDPFQDGATCISDHLFTWCGRPGALTCIDWRSGETSWTQNQASLVTADANPPPSRRGRTGPRDRQIGSNVGRTGLTSADGHLYCLSSEGALRLVEANPIEYVEKSAFLIPNYQPALGATLPIITGGHLYIRDNNRLLCFDVRRDTTQTGQDPAPIVLAKPDSHVPLPLRQSPRPIFFPTPDNIVEKMLEMASAGPDELLVDLGSGDGRIVIKAAEAYRCRSIGYEIDPDLVETSRSRVETKGLAGLVSIRDEDMFKADLTAVDVVAVYLYPSILEKLMPQFEQLKPGARIVSHFFEIPGVEPNQTVRVRSAASGEIHQVFLYRTPFEKKTKSTPR